MATATMGLRRRVPVNNSPTPSGHSSSNVSASSKRSRSDNNNSPSQGNLNSVNGSREEPPTKKSRGTTTSGGKSNASSSLSASNNSGVVSLTETNSSSSKSRGSSISRSSNQTKTSSGNNNSNVVNGDHPSNVPASSWSTTTSNMSDVSTYAAVAGLGMTNGQGTGLCATNLGMTTSIPPYMSTSMATFVGNATNLGKSSSVSYLDISNMTSGSLGTSNATNSLASGYGTNKTTGTNLDSNSSGVKTMAFPGIPSANVNANGYGSAQQKGQNQTDSVPLPKKFQNDGMFNAYQPWVIKTYGDLAKTKTITIKKYARILRTLRGEEVNSAENSKFRFWVKSKGFHIGQPEGYDAKPADRIVGRHAVTNPGLDPPLYVPTQLPHNKALNGAEGTVPPGRIYKKVAIVENFFDIIHAVHVDLEGRPGKHAGQKRTYRTITETYAFLPREAVTRFLLGCTECQRRPRTPSPTNLSNQSSHPVVISSSITSTSSSTTTTTSSTSTRLSPTTSLAVTSNSTSQNNNNANTVGSNKSKDNTESKNSYNYRHHKQHHLKNNVVVVPANNTTDIKNDKDKEEKYNPLSITNLLKKEPNNSNGGFLSSTETLPESRRTPESDRASSRSSASSKRKRMLPEGRTPSPQPSQPLPRPWSPGLDPKNTPIDYSLPITTSYLKHQQRMAEKNKALKEAEEEQQQQLQQKQQQQQKIIAMEIDADNVERERFSPAAGLIDTNLNLLATIQDLHFQVMVALNERLRPSISMPTPLVLPSAHIISGGPIITGSEVSVQTGEHHL